ncbi:HAMP domain-containing sensor histidine kinase [Archangium sp.]|uniref:sensor histidine kinase n=1 Tax=Archangium sp. TaxID=1872627 RepID=UPI002D346C52|nr:HAMP domain-containing sensor histidine kinase [Archangium sp.]HYO55342.1 HAMP domain-containing sensor histidine kinase [Archangium sp.]
MSGQSGLESVLDFLAVPVLRVEEGSARVLSVNAMARTLPFSLERGAVLDEAGAPLPPEQHPVRRAARGEPLEGALFRWETPEGDRTFVVHARMDRSCTPGVATVTFQDVTRWQRAEVDLRRALGARDTFLSVASHELRSPITVLQLVLERLHRGARREETFSGVQVAERLEPALRQVRRLGVLVQNLLDVSRARNNRFDLDRERFALSSLVREVCERFAEQARHAGSDLLMEDCPQVEVHWDRLRVEQALSNLITNAIKYGAGGPISVRAEWQDGEVSLQVWDRGIGVADGDHERIFNPFERAASGHRVESLGLGLYIVREIARAHGGTVGITGREGGGSCFTLRLPLEATERGE